MAEVLLRQRLMAGRSGGTVRHRACRVWSLTRDEERLARKETRRIEPDNIELLVSKHLARIPYKTTSCRYHSFVIYFSNLKRLGWVEATRQEESSAFQDHYANGQPRRYFRLTAAGRAASDVAWANPLLALYGGK